MSEEPSPASTSSTSGKQSDTSSPSSKNSREPRLVIRKQPPTHVYSDEWFDIEVGLETLRGSPGTSEADLAATLENFESGQLFSDEATLTVNPERIHLSTLSTPSKRHQTVRCRINTTDLPKEKSLAFVIRFSPTNGRDTNQRGLQPVTTRPIRLVRLKLDIKENRGWESVWYKDEGGRDKCMTVTAGIYNRDKALVKGEKIPLQLTLCYDNHDEPVRVSKQEIFRMIGSTRHYIDKKSGTATLRFRIEDVSKNHQGQDFRVEVAADAKASGFKDIAPTYTPNVSIRSKRNKRQRSVSATGRSEAKGPSPMGGRPPFAAQGRSASYPGEEHEASLASPDVSRLREAMKGVISWTDDVVNGLYPLQWHIIGYAQNPDGTPDYNRPYHSMPNPNATISRVLSTYSESTRENLRVLLAAVEKTSPGSQVDAPYLLPGVGMAGERFGALEGPPPPMIPPPIDQRMPTAQGAYGAASFQAVPGVEGFRDKRDTDMSYGGQGLGVAMRQSQSMYQQTGIRSRPQGAGTVPAQAHAQDASLPAHHLPGKSTGLEREQQRLQPIPVHETQRAQRPFEEESRENEVEYVLAKQFKALRTGERLGFPAYSASKELLGFYRESSMKVGVGQFVPLSAHREDFGHMERIQATEILEEAIATKSEAFHALKDWGSISSLVDHALVYDWTKEIGGNSNAS